MVDDWGMKNVPPPPRMSASHAMPTSEKVAKAICRVRLIATERKDWTRGLRTAPYGGTDLERDVEKHWQTCIPEADAAIAAAMEEPGDSSADRYIEVLEASRTSYMRMHADEEKSHSETRAQLAAAQEALRVVAQRLGPLEDNHMLHPDCRAVFALIRETLPLRKMLDPKERPYSLDKLEREINEGRDD